MTTLSVVIPVRDCGDFLADALTSLRHNARPDFQFVLVDDGSTDSTAAVAEEFRELLPTLEVVRHRQPVGLASARNAGLERAEGRYVTYLDGDDWLAPGYLARLVESIEALGCDFVRADHVQVSGRRRTVHHAPAPRDVVLDPRGSILPAHRRSMVDYPYAWAGIYRRSLGDLLRFPDGLHTAEDRPWIWRLHREARSYAAVSLCGVFYRRMVAASLTQIGDARQLHFFDAYDLVLAQVWDEPELLPKAVRQFVALLVHHLRLDERSDPRVRAQFRARARASLARLPHGVLAEAGVDTARLELLRPLLPGGRRAELRR